MLKFVGRSVFESTRSILALVIAAVTISGALYLGVHPLGHSPSKGCADSGNLLVCIISRGGVLWWQIPVGIAIGVVGLASAGVIGTWRRTRRRPQSELSSPLQWR